MSGLRALSCTYEVVGVWSICVGCLGCSVIFVIVRFRTCLFRCYTIAVCISLTCVLWVLWLDLYVHEAMMFAGAAWMRVFKAFMQDLLFILGAGRKFGILTHVGFMPKRWVGCLFRMSIRLLSGVTGRIDGGCAVNVGCEVGYLCILGLAITTMIWFVVGIVLEDGAMVAHIIVVSRRILWFVNSGILRILGFFGCLTGGLYGFRSELGCLVIANYRVELRCLQAFWALRVACRVLFWVIDCWTFKGYRVGCGVWSFQNSVRDCVGCGYFGY
eukprot:gene3532-2483_t